jgi:hypothetical protein
LNSGPHASYGNEIFNSFTNYSTHTTLRSFINLYLVVLWFEPRAS